MNLFASQLRGCKLVATVEESLNRHGLPPEMLELEITENIALGYGDEFLSPLHQLRSRGVGIAFDDFGTGFASLSALKRFPLSRLKIDRSFVRDLHSDEHDAAIIKAVLTLGQSLGLGVVAEGIETVEQQAFLTAQGCPEGQGYLFSRPVTGAQMADLLSPAPAKEAL